RLRGLERQRVGHDQTLGTRQLREHRAQRPAVHLAVHLLLEAARLGGEGLATADPDRRAVGARTRLAGAFLAPGLPAAAADLGARLLRLGAGTAGVAVGGDHLVHQRLVERLAEGRLGHLELAGSAGHLELHGALLLRLLHRVGRRRRADLGGRDGLAQSAPRRLQRRTDDDLAALRTGHGAADEEQIALDIDLHDLEILRRAAHHAHVAGHPPALEHAARGLALADGAGRAVRHRHAVGRRQATEVVPLHRAREALAFRRAGDVDPLAGLEEVHFDLGARLEIDLVAIRQAEFHQRLAGRHVGLGVVAGDGLGIKLRPARAESDLHGAIAFLVLGLHLGHAIGQDLDHGDRNGLSRIGEHPRHARFAADDSNCHCLSLLSTGENRRGDFRETLHSFRGPRERPLARYSGGRRTTGEGRAEPAAPASRVVLEPAAPTSPDAKGARSIVALLYWLQVAFGGYSAFLASPLRGRLRRSKSLPAILCSETLHSLRGPGSGPGPLDHYSCPN